MKFKYTADKKSLVTKYENQILSEYKKYIEGTEIIKAFYSLCTKYDCGVKIGLGWINEIRNEYSKSRLPIERATVAWCVLNFKKMAQYCASGHMTEKPIITLFLLNGL